MGTHPKTVSEAEPASDQFLRELNSALIMSSVRQHELAEEVREAEKSARASEARFRLLAETVPQKIFITDAQGTATYFNPEWVTFTGLSIEQLLERGWLQIVLVDELDESLGTWKHSMETGEPFLFEHRLRQADGQERWHISRAVPMRNEEGRIEMWVGTCADEDDFKRFDEVQRVRLENEVVLRTAELLAANEQLQGFTYGVAHDLRQQIRGISSSASIILSDAAGVLDGENKRMLLRMVDSSRRLAQLVDDLLAYARLGRQEPIKAPIDLTSIAKEIVAFQAEGGICRPGARFEIEPGLWAVGDATMIRIVLENLIGNACKFSSGSDRAVIEMGREGNAFFVRDNGAGFDMTFISRLFQPFERLHSSADFKGTGIGLANVRRIVEKHGGKVWAVGEPGVGATFYFTLGRPDPEPS